MKYISALFFVFCIAVIILADNGSLPRPIRALYDFPNGDKLGHFILFGALTFFIIRAFLSSFPSKPRGWVALSVGLILALLIGLEEFSQKLFSTRSFDLIDLLASYAGIITFALLAVYWKRPAKFEDKGDNP
jgi:polysaccharide biosynthesis protein VpsQ